MDESVKQFLGRPEHYGGHLPEVAETHISLVFMGDERVLKLKKPAHFDVLDFSTVQARQAACEREVTLNRRLAPDVYRGVLAIIRRDDGSLALVAEKQAQGNVVDWLVEMRRLPARLMLDRLIAGRSFDSEMLQPLIQVLVTFYKNAQRVVLPPGQLQARMIRHVRENLAALRLHSHELPGDIVERVHGRQHQLLGLSGARLDDRVRRGLVVDGHGDLRPEHVCLEPRPVIYDCIEFSDTLRQVDIADEVAFFAMECEALGAPEIGRTVLSACLGSVGDDPPADLVSFYESYRACVRAKVSVLRHAPGAAQRYLALADRPLGPLAVPVCLVMRGVSGSGKSTVAAWLAERLGLAHLRTDEVRGEVLASDRGDGVFATGRYTPERRLAVYERLLAEAATILRAGRSVVLDGTFLWQATVAKAAQVARSAGARELVVHCVCDERMARQRIASRKDGLSEARPEHVDEQRRAFESEPPGIPCVRIDTGPLCPPDESLLQSLASLLTTGSDGVSAARPPRHGLGHRTDS